ncbi:hypothetical protein GCM10028807_24140 [Spirosoma daeguense]
MAQEQDMMSRMKRLTRVNKEGGSMTAKERAWFEEKKREGQIMTNLAKGSTIHK